MKTVIDKLTKQYDLWVGYKEIEDGYKYLVICKKKVKGGIRYLVYWYKELDVKKIKSDIVKYGTFSPRPYKLAQPCDGSIDQTAFALFINFCRAKNINPEEFYQKTYQDEGHKEIDCDFILRLADWEGVEYPELWDKKAYEGMLESLTEINYHSLVGALESLNLWMD
jgi:hypothetical protein